MPLARGTHPQQSRARLPESCHRRKNSTIVPSTGYVSPDLCGKLVRLPRDHSILMQDRAPAVANTPSEKRDPTSDCTLQIRTASIISWHRLRLPFFWEISGSSDRSPTAPLQLSSSRRGHAFTCTNMRLLPAKSIASPCRGAGAAHATRGRSSHARQAASFRRKVPEPPVKERGMLSGCVGSARVKCGRRDTPSCEAMEWQLAEVKGTPPPARLGHTAVYAAELQKMLVFGGEDGPLLSPRGRVAAQGPFFRKACVQCSAEVAAKAPALGGDGPLSSQSMHALRVALLEISTISGSST